MPLRTRSHARRRRAGRLLIECLVSLTVVAAGVASLAPARMGLVALADDATQLDLAGASVQAGASRLLRGPCTPAADPSVLVRSQRHAADVVVAGDEVRVATVTDRWTSLTGAAHRPHLLQARSGARCE